MTDKTISIVYHWNKKKKENVSLETETTLKELNFDPKEHKVFHNLEAYSEFLDDQIRLGFEKMEDVSTAFFKATQTAMKEFPAYYDLLKPLMYTEAKK